MRVPDAMAEARFGVPDPSPIAIVSGRSMASVAPRARPSGAHDPRERGIPEGAPRCVVTRADRPINTIAFGESSIQDGHQEGAWPIQWRISY